MSEDVNHGYWSSGRNQHFSRKTEIRPFGLVNLGLMHFWLRKIIIHFRIFHFWCQQITIFLTNNGSNGQNIGEWPFSENGALAPILAQTLHRRYYLLIMQRCLTNILWGFSGIITTFTLLFRRNWWCRRNGTLFSFWAIYAKWAMAGHVCDIEPKNCAEPIFRDQSKWKFTL